MVKDKEITKQAENPLKGLKETAKWLDIHPCTLRNMSKMGLIPTYRLGKKYLYILDEVVASLKKDAKKTAKDIGLDRKGISSTNGYLQVFIGKHPLSDKNGYVLLHRLIMQAIVGRPLEKGEIVHAKNGNPLDLRASNLELLKSLAEHNSRRKSLEEFGDAEM